METANQNTNDLQTAPQSEPQSRQDDFHYMPRAGTQLSHFVCYRCGGNHKAPDCKHKDAICNKCTKKDHLAKVCRSGSVRPEVSKNQKQRQQTNTKMDPQTTRTHHLDAGTDEDEYNLFTVAPSTNQPLTVPLTLNGANLIMEIDTGATRSIISD